MACPTIVGTHPATGKKDLIFYIRYRRGGVRYHEKAGRASIDGMTAATANKMRILRMEGEEGRSERGTARGGGSGQEGGGGALDLRSAVGGMEEGEPEQALQGERRQPI